MSDIIENLSNRDARFVTKNGAPLRVSICKRTNDDDGDGETIDAELFDVSSTGAKLRAVHPIQIKESVSLEITAVDSDQELCVAGAICWVSPASADEWWIGCQFEPKIPEDLLLDFAEEGLLERRQSDRLAVSVATKAKWELSQDESDARLLNYSSGGFCLESNDKQRAGARVLVYFDPENGSDRIQVKGKAIWQVKVGGVFVVGCEFQDERGYQTLKSLKDKLAMAPIEDETEEGATSKTSVWRRWLGKA